MPTTRRPRRPPMPAGIPGAGIPGMGSDPFGGLLLPPVTVTSAATGPVAPPVTVPPPQPQVILCNSCGLRITAEQPACNNRHCYNASRPDRRRHALQGCCGCFSCVASSTHNTPHNANMRIEGQCDQCRQCNDHCACLRCDSCSAICSTTNPARERCARCNNCAGCCTCTRVQFFNGPTDAAGRPRPLFHTASKLQHKLNPSSRYIALEIEVAGARKDIEVSNTVKKWGGAIVADGSLPSGGFEINTGPASGDLFVTQMTQIAKALEDSKSWLDHRCGLHVHIDCRDLNFYDMRRIVKYYALIEQALFSVVADDRQGSQYCEPCGENMAMELDNPNVRKDPKASKHILLQSIYGVRRAADTVFDVRRVKEEHRNHNRYRSLNFHSWIYRGTLECRMHHGTINKDNLVNWGMLWAALIDFAAKSTEATIDGFRKNGALALNGKDGLDLLKRTAATSEVLQKWLEDRRRFWKENRGYRSSRTMTQEV